ncbi:hypothetical protein VTN77DRAFT_4850 [Rasamsonia byssochlamydoides]|uniref:uncharacterized protein n=1 Tax=Rasamsonia byssochlamydoides TaxID=89139 RepID=UPI003743E89E
MSLLQNEDFTIWQLRTSYLSAIKDGIGDRLINVNNSVLNTPGFRAAGWFPLSINPAVQDSAAQIKRTYSPPIPTTATVASEYYRLARYGNAEEREGDGLGIGEDDEGGMVTGGGGSTHTLGTRNHGRGARRNRRRERQQNDQRYGEGEDEDSSDLSDESDEDGGGGEFTQRAAQQIKFSKMPIRTRAGSSPIRASSDRRVGPEVTVTCPSRASPDNRYRRSSAGAVEVMKVRSRGDTTTSSDLSENELDPALFKRRTIHFSSEHQVIEEPADREPEGTNEVTEVTADHNSEMTAGEINENEQDEDFGGESADSVLSSDFGATAGSPSLLAEVDMNGTLDSSPIVMHKLPNAGSTQGVSPKKPKNSAPVLQDLPPPRPISTVQPVSLLTKELKARKKVPSNPVERFAPLWANGSTTALNVKIYAPFSNQPDKPFDLPIFREFKDEDHSGPVTVADAIGLSLWRYMKEDIKPPIEGDKLNVNRWTLRMVEDGEIEYDFPPLGRNLPLADFTSNNNRAAALRGRIRGKPYDEFALVEATQEEFEENERLYPKFSTPEKSEESGEPASSEAAQPNPTPAPQNKPATTRLNPILNQPFSSALNDNTLTPADRPAVPTNHATPRLGVSKTLKVRFINVDGSSQMMTVNTSTDSYIAEILDSVCKRWGLDKGNYLLKVMGSNTVAPLDRTVEALGSVTELDVVRRRFGAGSSLTASPGSSSPNAPLMIDNANNAASKKGKKGQQMLHPLAQKQDLVGGYYRRYYVFRKQSMSFTTSNQRVLVLDNDYLHIMPADSGKGVFEHTGKTRSISFNDIVGSKVSRRHPKSFRVVVLRGNEANEQKRYDFEARNELEAVEIVDEIKKNMAHYRI